MLSGKRNINNAVFEIASLISNSYRTRFNLFSTEVVLTAIILSQLVLSAIVQFANGESTLHLSYLPAVLLTL